MRRIKSVNISRKKDLIRTDLLLRRYKLDAGRIRRASAAIQRRVLALEEWGKAKSVCCYLALPCEAQTGELVRACCKSRKRLCVPVFSKKKRAYRLAWLTQNAALVAGHWKIQEPAKPCWLKSGRIDLAIIPGVAFDRRGGRIGFGRGIFDRLLKSAALRGSFKLGLAYQFQLQSEVPVARDDVRMDAVVTEQAIYRPARRRTR